MAPAKRPTISSFLKQDALMSIELNKLVMDPVDVKTYLDKFSNIVSPSSQTIQSFAKLFHKAASDSFDVKMKMFGSNETSMVNETIRSYHLDGSIRLIANKSIPITSVPQTATSIDITTRFTFELINQPSWMLQVDLTKTLSNPLEFAAKLQAAKSILVDIPLDQMRPDAYDNVTTSLVHIGSEQLTHIQITELLDDITSCGDEEKSSEEYQSSIYELAKDIFRDAITISQFKRQSGFKRLGSNTIEMSRPMFFKQVLPVIDTFYMTDKMDGIRAMLVIDECYRRSGHRRIYLGSDIKAVSDQVYTIASFKKPSNSKTIEVDHTVLDVEMMIDSKDNKTFHCFDVIAFESKRVSNSPFKDRLAKFDSVKTLMEKYELGTVKEFVKLTKTEFATQIKDFYKKKRSYHIDGLIFTPEGMYHKDAAKTKKNKYDRVFNTDYSSTVSFKWKPLDQLTIDFYLMDHPTKKNAYILCSGIDSRTFAQLQMKFFDGYKAPESPNAHKYFPIQFEPYDGEFDNVWTPTKEEHALCIDECKSLTGQVGEFTFADKNGLLDKPKLIRLRTDRMQDIAKGEYFGNALRYAELIWHSVNYPLTIEAMCNPTDIGYFANDDNDLYRAQRNFNSFVKTYLMETYLYPKTSEKARLMDIACGKGQDIARAIDIGFEEIIALDKDVDAIYELLERKYNLRVKRKGAAANIHVKQLDLEDSSEDIIKSLKIQAGSVDAANCSFAIHYICHSAAPGKIDPLTEFAKMTCHYLKSGARIMLTAFNGKDVFNALAGKDEWSLKEKGHVKYSIKRDFSSETLTAKDQPISVLLPFSGGNYYTEFLVNYDNLQDVFEKNGFRLVKTDGFGSLLKAYKKANAKGYALLSREDQEYVSLYGYLIFEKM